ncbi:MAG: peptidoglycan recognition family protein [Proteobacteria bacterium]|nr:peptidoglycan recognition family protein [Pseudomonadota bacterium]
MKCVAGLVLLVGCALDPTPTGAVSAPTPVSGDSPLATMFARVGAAHGVPADVLAATSYVRTRLHVVDVADGEHAGQAIGLFGLRDADVVRGASLAGVTDEAARHDPEASAHAFAALLVANGGGDPLDQVAALGGERFAHEVGSVLARGLDARDPDGARLVVAARPDAARGLGIARAAGDYPGSVFDAASSSNYQTANRGVGAIDHIVIHDTEGSFSGSVSWFKDPAASVSAHYMLRSSDGYVVQMVREKNIAWHDKCFNTTTVGIEHEGYLAHPEQWYTEKMYVESAKLASYLADKYGIAKERGPIVGHGDAPDCSDHTDPGPGWDWVHYIDLVKTGGAPMFNADSVVVEAPATMVTGEVATVTVTLANTGNTTWDLDTTRLGTAAPQDRASAMFVDGDWIAPNRTSGIDAVVAPHKTGSFTFQIQAPPVTASTVFDEAFQPVADGMTWFGPEVHVVVEVSPLPGDPDSGGCSTGGGGGGAGVLVGVALVALRRRRR